MYTCAYICLYVCTYDWYIYTVEGASCTVHVKWILLLDEINCWNVCTVCQKVQSSREVLTSLMKHPLNCGGTSECLARG